ncbi:MAG: TraR/DksA C4-type zinc finger protein [bacterium]
MTIDTKHFAELLEAKKNQLEAEMSLIARRNPANPNDWEPIELDGDNNRAVNEDEVADEIESFENNASVLENLEAEYDKVLVSLNKIKDGTYGKCSVGGEDIPVARLEVEPAADTCIEHAK